MKIKLNAENVKWEVNTKNFIKNFIDLKWGSLLTDTVEIKDDVEGLAFLLLFQTVRKTTVELLKEYGQKELNENYNLVTDNAIFENNLKHFFETEIVITRDFFENPLQFSPKYITSSFALFKEYAEILKINLPYNVSANYYKMFVVFLEIEYQSEKEKV